MKLQGDHWDRPVGLVHPPNQMRGVPSTDTRAHVWTVTLVLTKRKSVTVTLAYGNEDKRKSTGPDEVIPEYDEKGIRPGRLKGKQ